MGHSVRVRVRVGSCLGRVIFGLSDISGRFSLGRVWFGSGRFRVNQFLVKHACHAKTSNFVENFGSGMVRFGSIGVSGPLLGEHILGVGSGMGPGRSVWVSGLRSFLLDMVVDLKRPNSEIAFASGFSKLHTTSGRVGFRSRPQKT